MSRRSRRAAELRRIAVHLLKIADDMELGRPSPEDAQPERLSGDIPALNDWRHLKPPSILAKVDEIYALRRRRRNFLPAELFGEPGWDILLDLFAAKLQNRNISVSSSCIAADVPPTTALRWIKMMEQIGIIDRSINSSDMRVSWVKLSDSAEKMMNDYFVSSL